MAVYPKAIQRLIPPGPTDPRIDPDTVVLHVDAGNAESLHAWFAGPSGGVESHFHVRKDGVVEQYRDTAFQADAQRRAGKDAVSIETQGVAAGEWTPLQLAAIQELLLWLAETHRRIPLRPVTSLAGPGIGYHSQYREWTGDARSCPGPDRIKQFHAVLIPWMANPESAQEDDMQPEDLARWDGFPAPDKSTTNPTWSLATYVPATYRNARGAFQGISRLEAQVTALTAAVQTLASAGGSMTPEQFQGALDAAARDLFARLAAAAGEDAA